jgi:uncharacterized protein with PIN domain/mRNA deadenylase 3'-5' endonuclease subunit Ccr4
MKKKSSRKKKRRPPLKQSDPGARPKMPTSWVDNVGFYSLDQQDNRKGDANGEVSLSVICWNVLADGYCSPNSHQRLPGQYREIVFNRMRRGSLLRKIFCSGQMMPAPFDSSDSDSSPEENNAIHLLPDVWALQEVDIEDIQKILSSVGYECVETPRTQIGCGNGGRVDSCGIYYLKDRWTLIDQELIRLDDLATLPASTNIEAAVESVIDSVNNNLQGLQQSFLRRNAGLLVRLQHKENPQVTVVIIVTHLFWNPLYEFVKLMQMHYVMIRATAFLKDDNEPVVMCGDLNSLPGSCVHTYLAKGVVNAQSVAPWYRAGTSTTTQANQEMDADAVCSMTDRASTLSITQHGFANGFTGLSKQQQYLQIPQKQVRYLLDYNLNRLCRWFRILGLDAGLETEDEERMRTKEGKIKLFDRCREEHRVLVTTSNKLLLRKDCPAGTYLINPKSLKANLEIVFVHILLTHGVVLEPSEFLSRCVVCNGNICTVHDPESKRKIFLEYQAPIDVSEDLEVYQCTGCQQGYWWCDRPTSSATRVKSQATKLFQMCLRANVPISTSKEKHMFEHVNVYEERQKGWDWSLNGSELLKLRLQVTEWLKEGQLNCPIKQLQSAYHHNSDRGESLPFTNVTYDFEGTLDYIFFDTQSFLQTERLYVPTTYEELNTEGLPNGHLLPSNVWPSDHLAIGVTLKILSSDNEKSSPTAGASVVGAPDAVNDALFCAPVADQPHGERCSCGCVPPVLSLFEMAKLRKQAKIRAAAAASSTN